MIDFSQVTDVKIPQGDVIKIVETATSRVLWEKQTVNKFVVRATNAFGYHECVYELTVK